MNYVLELPKFFSARRDAGRADEIAHNSRKNSILPSVKYNPKSQNSKPKTQTQTQNAKKPKIFWGNQTQTQKFWASLPVNLKLKAENASKTFLPNK